MVQIKHVNKTNKKTKNNPSTQCNTNSHWHQEVKSQSFLTRSIQKTRVTPSSPCHTVYYHRSPSFRCPILISEKTPSISMNPYANAYSAKLAPGDSTPTPNQPLFLEINHCRMPIFTAKVTMPFNSIQQNHQESLISPNPW